MSHQKSVIINVHITWLEGWAAEDASVEVNAVTGSTNTAMMDLKNVLGNWATVCFGACFAVSWGVREFFLKSFEHFSSSRSVYYLTDDMPQESFTLADK